MIAATVMRERAVALRELGPVRAVDERDMGHGRHVPAERPVELALARGVGEMVVAADHVRSQRVSQDSLNWALGKMGRVKGVGHARRAVEHSVNDAESPWESYARALILEAALPGIRGSSGEGGAVSNSSCAVV